MIAGAAQADVAVLVLFFTSFSFSSFHIHTSPLVPH
jgi:hypothetical protein